MISNDQDSLSEDTIFSYINALKRIFVIEDLPAWNPNLRSKTAIRISDKHHFVDPLIAVAALGIGPGDLLNDLNTMGLLFESMCIRDLRVYAQSLGGSDIDKAAKSLILLRDKIDTTRMKAPSFLMVLTWTTFGYRREDGVYVVPCGCLKG